MKRPGSRSQSFWIYGIHPITAALQTGQPPILELAIMEGGPQLDAIIQAATASNIPVHREDRKALNRRLGTEHHQGVAARVADFPYGILEVALENPPSQHDPWVLLDSIQDPQNLGAILRSASFLGAVGVVIPKDRSVAVTASVVKVAAGATAHLPVYRVTNLARTIGEMKERGWWVIGLDTGADRPLYQTDLTVPLALVVGNEQKGLRPLVKKECDLLAAIPARGPLQSLNASVAAAIALAETQRQRSQA